MRYYTREWKFIFIFPSIDFIISFTRSLFSSYHKIDFHSISPNKLIICNNSKHLFKSQFFSDLEIEQSQMNNGQSHQSRIWQYDRMHNASRRLLEKGDGISGKGWGQRGGGGRRRDKLNPLTLGIAFHFCLHRHYDTRYFVCGETLDAVNVSRANTPRYILKRK